MLKNKFQTVFRYPGGKKKLAAKIVLEMSKDLENSSVFCEPFVGGGSVAICVAENFPNMKIVINDTDLGISDFWKTVVSTKWSELAEMVYACRPDLTMFYQIKSSIPTTTLESAFRTLFLNRTTFSGILNGSPIGGKGQLSKYPVDCRYNGPSLSYKIETLHSLLVGRTSVFNTDGIEMIGIILDRNAVVYADPPYDQDEKTAIYGHLFRESNHRMLADSLKARDRWVASYNDNAFIREIYSWARIEKIPHKYTMNGKKTTWSGSGELLIRPT